MIKKMTVIILNTIGWLLEIVKYISSMYDQRAEKNFSSFIRTF